METAWDWEQHLGARTSEQDYGDGCFSVADTGQLCVLTAVALPDKRKYLFFFPFRMCLKSQKLELVMKHFELTACLLHYDSFG